MQYAFVKEVTHVIASTAFGVSLETPDEPFLWARQLLAKMKWTGVTVLQRGHGRTMARQDEPAAGNRGEGKR